MIPHIFCTAIGIEFCCFFDPDFDTDPDSDLDKQITRCAAMIKTILEQQRGSIYDQTF